ncbi:MAG: DUF1015 family protein [Myxococcota bacterium]|jgi:uncharacterized protein (DUF1015 family)
MSSIRPFRAYRPLQSIAGKVASVPYDVVNTAEAAELAAGNAYSFLHVARPEIDLPAGTGLYDDAVYEKGAANLKRIISGPEFMHEDRPCMYLYRQVMGGRAQTGLVCLCPVKEYENGLIKKHEHTRRDKEDDRVRHVTAQNANAEPVFLTYRACPAIDSIVAGICAGAPVADIVSPDGIGHTVWLVKEEGDILALEKEFSAVPALYVADGHHRTAAACRYGAARRAGGGTDPDASYEWFMAVVFPHDQLMIMDYNRLVKDLNGLDEAGFLKAVGEKFEVAPSESPRPDGPTRFGMYVGGRWYSLSARAGTFPAGDPIKGLDVSILQDNLLFPILGIADPRTDKRIDFVGGIRGTGELERRVRDGWAVAFSMFPTSLVQLMAVADAGEVMPPKSTWFEPKLRSGLVVRVYE